MQVADLERLLSQSRLATYFQLFQMTIKKQ
jgi:hypothetical protein